jgi:hypothetical protein
MALTTKGQGGIRINEMGKGQRQIAATNKIMAKVSTNKIMAKVSATENFASPSHNTDSPRPYKWRAAQVFRGDSSRSRAK